MKRLLLYLFSISFGSFAQPNIGTSDGIAKYGYIEKNSLTRTFLYKGNHDNINYLGARWLVSYPGNPDAEYIYYTYDGPDGNWNCNNSISYKRTNDYSPSHFGSNWEAGANVRVGVYAYYGCPHNSSYEVSPGYDYKDFQVFDYEPAAVDCGKLFDANGDCGATATGGNNVVASFTLDVGTLSGKSLERLFFKNTGSLQEGSGIPNGGFKLFYEPATGSETFDGTESNATLYGDWGGNSTSNNEYAAENLNISFPSSGKMRFYVVLCDIVDGVDPAAHQGTAVELELMNDGMSLGPANHSHSLARIDSGPLSSTDCNKPLPVTWLSVDSKNYNDNAIRVSWQTASETNNMHFDIQRSSDATDFTTLARVNGNGTTTEQNSYEFIDLQPLSGNNYYRVKQVDLDGTEHFSKIVSSYFESDKQNLLVYPNPVENIITVSDVRFVKTVEIVDEAGKLWLSQAVNGHKYDISKIPSGKYFLILRKLDNSTVSEKLVKP